MNNLKTVWKNKTGKDAKGNVTLGYELSVEGDGCCEICYAEEAVVSFYLVEEEGNKTFVSDFDLGIKEIF